MADNIPITQGIGTTVATDDVAGVHYQRVKVVWGADGVVNDANVTTPLPVTASQTTATNLRMAGGDAAGAPTAGTVLAIQGIASGTVVPVGDGAGSLTVDAPVSTPVAARLSDGTAFLTTTSGRLAVDPSGVTSPISAASLPLPAGAATLAAQTQPGVDIGDVTVNNAAGAAAVNIQDGGNSLTVDAPVGTPVATRLSDGTSFLTTTGGRLSVDASGVAVPVTDNAGSLTVDQPTATNLRMAGGDAAGSPTAGTVLAVQGIASGTAVPISAASLPLPTGAATSALQTQPGVDIGDVTVNNAAGASAVNVQDGGNVITVDGTVTDGGSGKTLKSASFSLTATGTAITAVGGKRLKVYAVKLVVSAAISVNWRDGASTNMEGAQALAANGGYVEGINPPAFLFGTTAGNSLDLVITGTGTAAGRVSYWDDDGS